VPALTVIVGTKHDQALEDGYPLAFSYTVAVANVDYVRIVLNADVGPLGTRDYSIVFEATPVAARRSFIHLSYSYAYGIAARVALNAYLATAGRNKVGFTVLGRRGGHPAYIRGLRGLVERNAMRYYLAIETYIGTIDTPESERMETRLRNWYDATENYAVQLHELERDEYLNMKRRELQRQQDSGNTFITPFAP
jgi:hypothetical protein